MLSIRSNVLITILIMPETALFTAPSIKLSVILPPIVSPKLSPKDPKLPTPGITQLAMLVASLFPKSSNLCCQLKFPLKTKWYLKKE